MARLLEEEDAAKVCQPTSQIWLSHCITDIALGKHWSQLPPLTYLTSSDSAAALLKRYKSCCLLQLALHAHCYRAIMMHFLIAEVLFG